jgi:hypothetical protein
VVVVDDVTGQRGDGGRVRQRGDGGGEALAVAGVDDDVPAAQDERAGEGEAEAAGGAGDEGDGGLVWRSHVGHAATSKSLQVKERVDGKDLLPIGEVAAGSGFSTSALRFYEKEGCSRRPGPAGGSAATRAASCAGWRSCGRRRTSG